MVDQCATQTILNKALMRLGYFYFKGIEKKGICLQNERQEPPGKFTNYKANAGASPVMGLLEQIVEDDTKFVNDATSSESQSQADYEKFV